MTDEYKSCNSKHIHTSCNYSLILLNVLFYKTIQDIVEQA